MGRAGRQKQVSVPLAPTPGPGSSYHQEAVRVARRLQPPGHAALAVQLIAVG